MTNENKDFNFEKAVQNRQPLLGKTGILNPLCQWYCKSDLGHCENEAVWRSKSRPPGLKNFT